MFEDTRLKLFCADGAIKVLVDSQSAYQEEFPMITRQTVIDIRCEIKEALAKIESKYGINFTIGNCSFTSTTGNFKFEFVENSPEGNPVSPEELAFKRNASFYGLAESDLGRVFASNGRKFKIIGLNTRAHKMPIIAEDISTGKQFVFSAFVVKSRLV